MAQTARPATARLPPRPPPSRPVPPSGSVPARAQAATARPASARPASAALAPRPPSAAPAAACSEDESDSNGDGGVVSGRVSSRFLSDRSLDAGEVSDLVCGLRAGGAYAAFAPPACPVALYDPARPLARPQSAALNRLYAIVDGHAAQSQRPSPSPAAPNQERAASASQHHPDVPPLFRPSSSPPGANPFARALASGRPISAVSLASAASSRPTSGFPYRPTHSHNYSDGSTGKTTQEETKRSDEAPASSGDEGEFQSELRASPSPSPPSESRGYRPDTARSQRSSHSARRRPLHPSRPSSAYLTNSSLIDLPSRQRDKLWAKYSIDAKNERERRERDATEPTALDQVLHFNAQQHMLHDATSNHALQGMKLVSSSGIEEIENAPVLSNDDLMLAAAQAAMEDLSDEDEEEDDDSEADVASDGGMARRAAEREESAAANFWSESPAAIDFARVGVEVARRLKSQGYPLSQSHLDVLHSLPLLERVWLASHSRGFGLSEGEFVDFLSSASAIRQPALFELFSKVDINSGARIGWDEYLNYIARELAQKWRMGAGAGTYVVRQDDSKLAAVRSDTATVIQQLLLLPQVGSSLFPTVTAKVVARCKNQTVQVFDAHSLDYLYHVPLHAHVKKRKLIWSYADEPPREEDVAQPHKAHSSTTSTASATGRADEKVLLYDAAMSSSAARTASITPLHLPAEHAVDVAASEDGPHHSRRSSTTGGSIRRFPKSVAGRRPSSARTHSDLPPPILIDQTNPRPFKLPGAKKQYRDRKLEAYLSAVEAVAAVPVAQPLACVGQERASGHPPPVERPATAGGIMYCDVLELAERNRPYNFSLTAIAHYPQGKQIVVAAADRSLRSFGLVRRTFECQDLMYVHETPQCLEVDTLQPGSYTGMHAQADRSLAITGSIAGSITAYNPATHARVAMLSGLHAGQPVRRLSLFPHVGLVSAGMDGRLAIVDPCTFQCTRFLGQYVDAYTTPLHDLTLGLGSAMASGGGGGSSRGHTSGVFSFALCPSNRTLLSVGFDREVYMWDPHLSHPTWKLPTQTSDLLDVLVNEAKNQVILIARDTKLRVYDMRNVSQIQETIDTSDYFPAGRLTACAFDRQRQEVLTAADKISVWHVEPSRTNKAALVSSQHVEEGVGLERAARSQAAALAASQKAHISSIVSVLYSVAFRQVVTVCENESIRVWNVFEGCTGPSFEFNTTHGAQLTAASLDWNGKRLLTACHEGRVLLWNHNNGELLFEFAPWGLEIGRICLLSTISQCLLAIGWSKNMLRWLAPPTGGPTSSAVKAASSLATEQEGHRAQILALATFGTFVVTADAEGEIVSWTDSGHKLHTLTLPRTSFRLRVHRDEASSSTAAPPILREACAPAVTCLEFFLVHDVTSYDSWAAAESASASSHVPSPPDYRQQHLHAHRVALFVGTDDGSVYVLSPQGLAVLHSAVHLMPDAIQAIALVQTVHLEETKSEAKADALLPSRHRTPHASRRASLAGAKSTPSGAPKTTDGLVTKLEAASKRLASSDQSSTTEKKTHSAAPRPHNPFLGQKSIVFRAVVKEAAPAPAPEEAIDDLTALLEEARLEEDLRDISRSPSAGLLAPVRKPFTSNFKLAPWDEPPPARDDDIAAAESLEEYLSIKKARAAALNAASATTRAKAEPTSAASSSTAAAAASAVGRRPTQAVEEPPAERIYRRVLRSHLLVADGMVGADAQLLSLTAEGTSSHGSVTLYRGSPSLVDQRVTLAPVKSLYLHSHPAATRPSLDDSTTTIQAVRQLPQPVFIVGSGRGHASVWSATGDWLCEFGQAANKGWPLQRSHSTTTESRSASITLAPEHALKLAESAASSEPDESAASEEHTDDAWSDRDDGNEMTAEEELEFARIQAQAMGFAPDDSSIAAMLASVRKKKLNNDGAKRGLAYGAAFAGVAKPIVLKNTPEFGGGALGAPTATMEPVIERPSTARTARQSARHRRLLEAPKLRYAESFRPMSARRAVTVNMGEGAVDTRTFAQLHPQYIPETLRAGGLRSAMFINDSKLRQSKSNAEDEAASQRARPTDEAEAKTGGSARAGLSFFELAPRDQAASALSAERVARSMFVETFLSNPRNLLDENGGVRDHAVARLALTLGAVDAQARKRADHQSRAAKPSHYRKPSELVRKENVFLRLSHTPNKSSARSQPVSRPQTARRPASAAAATKSGSATTTARRDSSAHLCPE